MFDYFFFLSKSLLYCKNDLFPEEGIWLWKNGMPLLSAFRTLAIGTLLGPQKERQVNWYLDPAHLEKLLSQLMPQLDKLAQIIQHYAISVCHFPLDWFSLFFGIVKKMWIGIGVLLCCLFLIVFL
jgi:hypothetical protein